MVPLKVIDIILQLVFLLIFSLKLKTILQVAIAKDSFEAVEYFNHEELLPPTISLCPIPALKAEGSFYNTTAFEENVFTWEEIFHPQVLRSLKNSSLFRTKLSFSSYQGRCFTIQKLRAEKVADYSFQLVLNNSLGTCGLLVLLFFRFW